MSVSQRNTRNLVVLALLAVGLAGWFVFKWWTRPPVVEFDNLKYIQLLTTAVSSQNPEQLEKVSLAVTNRFDDGKMSEKEFNALQKIVRQAKAGEWEQAHRACFHLAEGQLRRTRSQPVGGHQHAHRHDH